MSVTYVIKNFDFSEKTISFKVYQIFVPREFEVVFTSTEDMEDYEGVNRHVHYVDDKGDIVNVRDAKYSVVVNRGGKTFIRASQWQYDKWMYRHYPDSINARVYDTLCTNAFSIATCSELSRSAEIALPREYIIVSEP